METTAEGLGEILRGVAIRPPSLEDAGLEDCALPPESINEAFSRAADAVKSRIAISAEEEEDDDCYGCIQDPGPSNGPIPDTLISGGGDGSPTRPFCAANEERGVDGDREGDSDGEPAADRLLVLGGEEEEEGGKRSCIVDGDAVVSEGAHGGERNGGQGKGEDDLDEDDDKPILVEI